MAKKIYRLNRLITRDVSVFSREELLNCTNSIYVIIESRKTALEGKIGNVKTLLHTAIDKLQVAYNPFVLTEFKYNPSLVEADWKAFSRNGESAISDQSITALIARTRKLAATITSLNKSDFTRSPMSNQSPRIINVKANDLEIAALRGQITELKKKSADADADKQNLQSRILEMEGKVSSLEEENAAKKADQELEAELDRRIQTAFEALNQSTLKLDEEAKRASFDRTFYFWSMVVVVFAVVVWLIYFVYSITSTTSNIDSFLKIAPWYSPVLFLSALLWVSIVQRNKATRHLLMINQEVFKVKYIEGLLKSINKLSSSSEASMERISSLLDTLIKSYISKSDPEIAKFDQVKEKDAVVDADDIVKVIDAVSKAMKKY